MRQIKDSRGNFFTHSFKTHPLLRSVQETLIAMGETDLSSERIVGTPRRVENFIKEFFTPEPFKFTTFKADTDEMVVVKHIPFYSMCEHHMVPFFGVGHVGYLPSDKIVGLSKIPRALDHFAKKLQNQERIGTQLADYLCEHLQPLGVMVVLEARHLCMEMRGVEKPGTMTTTSVTRGAFKEQVNTRQEFLSLIK